MEGEFQQLIPGENGLETEFGPGTPGHLGGRWWIDLNADNLMDAGDSFFHNPFSGGHYLQLLSLIFADSCRLGIQCPMADFGFA